ncbi:hypothetical protein Q0N88_32750 [Bacillus thuringiensis]|uniref:hypothetical protein n=1 Tax=Bacillus thuringiensis TaxID=1428 RepID=UPI00345838C8
MDVAAEKIKELEEKYYKADRRADNAELQFGLLEREIDQLKKYQIDAIVYIATLLQNSPIKRHPKKRG